MNDKNSNQLYKGKIKLKKIFYPKGATVVNSGDFCIFVAEKIGMNNDNMNDGSFSKDIKLKGYVCYLDNKSEYNVTYKLADNNQYGKTYEIITINRNINTDDIDGQREFFKIFLSDNIIDELYKTYKTAENIKKILENEEFDKLTKIKGIGNSRAKRILNEFNDCKKYELVYSELSYLNLSPVMVKKIVDYYSSPEKAIKEINKDVYSLIKINGIGFKKADEIANKQGMPPTDPRRIKGYILHYLNEQAEIGKSYITVQELFNNSLDNLGEVISNTFDEAIDKLIAEKEVMLSDDNLLICLTKMYDLETKIYWELARINNYHKEVTDKDLERVEKAIKTSEEIQGFDFTDEQKQAIKDSVYHNIIAITGSAGCVDCDTEFLTTLGWKKIEQYQKGDKVLQYNPNGSVEFVEPLRYIKQKQGTLWYVHNNALNMCLSANHNCVYINAHNFIDNKTFDDIATIHYDTYCGFNGKFITGFNNIGNNFKIDDNILILYTIIILKGKYLSNDKNDSKYLLCSIRVKELHCYKRKLLVNALKELNIRFVERNKVNGFSDVIFYVPERIKTFPKIWYLLDKRQYEIIINVVRNYSTRHNTVDTLDDKLHFYTQWLYDKETADFIQFAIASTGHRGEIIQEQIIDTRYKDCLSRKFKWSVGWYKQNLVDFRYDGEKINFNEYKTKDGYEYCFTVPSGMLVLRRKNKIFVTGNCGKTTTANGIFRVFDSSEILACALSGKASVRIQEATGLENCATIHKTLGYDGVGFEYDDTNPLNCQCVFIDESTMVNGSLFLSILKAIPTGATLIICGDIKQLTPLGNCQVFYDVLKYSNVQKIELTKPHRQALKSGVISTSMSISNQKQILSPMDIGDFVFGELQDMIVKIQEDRTKIFDEIIQTFITEYNKTKDIIETQVILAVKNRGDVSCYYVNQKIQEIVNPVRNKFNSIEILSHSIGNQKYYYNIQVGDKVINIKNNYNCMNTNGDIVPIFNGNIGIVKEINGDECIIDFIGIGEVIFEKSNWSNLVLAYALTCHKVQGSGFDNVIIGLDSNSYLMNNSEWLYTAITRARKMCTLITTNSTLMQTIRQKETKKKQTFLGTFFEQYSI